jgi:rubrerythrin
MKDIFSGSEIIELGIQIEKNGRDFYTALAHQWKDSVAAEIFSYLAGEEGKHIQVFKNILEKTEQYEIPAAYADEYFAYMHALAGDYVFTQKNQGKHIARGVTSGKDAVITGIRFEKDSILFYEGIKKTVPENNQAIVDALIREEERHLKQLFDLRGKIDRGDTAL